MKRRHILLMQLDGSLPNLALARIAAHHAGDTLHFKAPRTIEGIERDLFDVPYDRVYASAIFEKTRPLASRLKAIYPHAIVGGTGVDFATTLASVGIPEDGPVDYSPWPSFQHSIGFTQRGCRLKCSFCVVPRKEGRIVVGDTPLDIWRGPGHPKNLILLDNDFFGSPLWPYMAWQCKAYGFKVNFCQGINARFLTNETAAAIASLDYFDSDFRKRRLYTAWDNRRDEHRLFAGLECLKRAGVSPSRVMVYVLIGFDHKTQSARGTVHDDHVFRIQRLREWGADPYPMPFVRTKETIAFQRWVCRFAEKRGVSWEAYREMGGRSDKAVVA
jgi:hypothetical protein